MEKRLGIEELRTQLRLVYPIRGWIYVGAGVGNEFDNYSLESLPALLAIEAVESNFAHLKKKLSVHAEWHCIQEVIAGQVKECDFYEIVPLSESGLVAPEHLATYWRNARLRGRATRVTATLSTAVSQFSNGKNNSYNWLTVDCFSGADILRGANELLPHFDVVEVRVLADGRHATDAAVSSTEEVDEVLASLHYSLRASVDERNPVFSRRFYTRDWRHCFERAELDLHALESEVEEERRAYRNERASIIARTEVVRKANDHMEVSLKAITRAKQMLQERLVISESEVTTLRDEQAALKKTLHAQEEQILSLQRESSEWESIREQNRRVIVEMQKIKDAAEQRSRDAEKLELVADNLRANLASLEKEKACLEQEKNIMVKARRVYLDELERASEQLRVIRCLLQRPDGVKRNHA